MNKLMTLALVALFACALYSSPKAAEKRDSAEPQFTADGKLMRPTNYREWVYLSSGLGMNYAAGGPNGQNVFTPAFTNVFVSPASYKVFKQTGKWPDRTIFALEAYSATTNGSINKQGHYQDSFSALEAEVKDARLKDGWAYYNFGPDGQTAAAFPKTACFGCHEKNGAVEHSFVQFYPDLLDTALKLGVIKDGVSIPTNASRLYASIKEKGWAAVEPEFEAAKAKEPGNELFTAEAGLNGIGYRLMAAGKNKDAVAVLKKVADEHPESANAWDSLADAYISTGQIDEARVASQKEIELAAKLEGPRKDQFTKLGQDRLEKLKK